jgi:hypothetical protein
MRCLRFRRNTDAPIAVAERSHENDPATFPRSVPVVSVVGGSAPTILEDASGKTMEVHYDLPFDN